MVQNIIMMNNTGFHNNVLIKTWFEGCQFYCLSNICLMSCTFLSKICASSANALFCSLHPSLLLAHNVFVRHGGPRARPGWTPTTRLSFHYFVIWIQRPPMHAINPVPSHHLHHFVCKLSLVCPCYFLQKSCLITCRLIILSFGLLYLLLLSYISYFPDIFVWTNVVTEKQALVVSHVSSGVVQITKHCSKYIIYI